jgi:hypothetical protein
MVRDFQQLIGEIPQVWRPRLRRAVKTGRFPHSSEVIRVVRILPLVVASIDVFRAALVSIVVTLTLGQNAALLCSIWCHPQQSANSACEHQAPMTSPTVTGNESCVQIAAGPTPLVREEARRVAADSSAQRGAVVARFQFVPQSTSTARDLERAQAPPPAAPTLVLALRI